MQVFTYGNDGRLAVCRRLLLAAHPQGSLARGVRDIHLLPIPSRNFSPSDFFSELKEGTGVPREAFGENKERATDLVVGYEVPAFFEQFSRVRVLDLSRHEGFLGRNARLSALGTVGILLTEHPRAVCDMRIGVIGYGRIGRDLVDILHFLESDLVVFTSNQEAIKELSKRRIASVKLSWNAISNGENDKSYLQIASKSRPIDVILNTSPSPLPKEFFAGFEGKIYDLASGTPIPTCVSHTRLPSLPMRMYHESAGHAVYESILSWLKSNP